jgi:hypothetical protein
MECYNEITLDVFKYLYYTGVASVQEILSTTKNKEIIDFHKSIIKEVK